MGASKESWPGGVDTVLFDAGGVLLDLDYRYLQRLVEAKARRVEIDALSRAEARARADVEKLVREGGKVSQAWRTYFHILFDYVEIRQDIQPYIIDSLWEAHERVGLWTVAIEGSIEVVEQLKKRGYRLGVVSNAEGRVARDLDEAGYRGLFEVVVDSHKVGVEKPDPAIFHLALERLGRRAESAIFLGDLPAVDVEGARAAGIHPVLVDRHDLYPKVSAARIGSLTELPRLLAQNCPA